MLDGISHFHLKFASDNNIRLIVEFINLCFRHNYVPTNISKGCIEPLIKDKLLDHSSINNYLLLLLLMGAHAGVAHRAQCAGKAYRFYKNTSERFSHFLKLHT